MRPVSSPPLEKMSDTIAGTRLPKQQMRWSQQSAHLLLQVRAPSVFSLSFIVKTIDFYLILRH